MLLLGSSGCPAAKDCTCRPSAKIIALANNIATFRVDIVWRADEKNVFIAFCCSCRRQTTLPVSTVIRIII